MEGYLEPAWAGNERADTGRNRCQGLPLTPWRREVGHAPARAVTIPPGEKSYPSARPLMTAQGQGDEQTTAAMLARIADAPTRAGKVSALLHALDWMRSIEIDPNGAQPGRITRERRIFAVTAVGQFFNAVGRNDLAEDFHALASTLSDINRGIVHKTLEKAPRKGGARPRSSDVWRGRAYVAAAVDALHRAGLQIKDIKRVLDLRPELGPLLDKKKRGIEYALGNAAEVWREQFNSGAVDNFEAMGTYNYCQSIAAKCAGPDDLKRHAEGLLQQATTRANEIERDSS